MYDYNVGPTVAIWPTPQSITSTPEDLLLVARQLDPSATAANDFRLADTALIPAKTRTGEPRPFGVALGEVGLDDAELATAADLLGFKPTVAVHAFAYANQQVDHRILGELALFLARKFRGLVDFGGNLGALMPPRGILVAIPYEASTRQETFHVADVDFLEWWLQQAGFHMIK